MVRLNEILNRLIIQNDNGCTYLNSSFNSTYITVIYKNGIVSIGKKIFLEDECEVILISINSSNRLLIAISKYNESEKNFETIFFKLTDLESESELDLDSDLSERYVTVIKAMIESKVKEYCHEEFQEM